MSDASAKTASARSPNVLAWYALVVAVAVGAFFIARDVAPDNPPLVDVDNFSIFAPMYIVAQAIERFLEPISRWSDPTRALKVAVANAKKASADGAAGTATALATAQATLADARGKRAIKLWAFASVVSLFVCAFFGLGLIEAVSKTPSPNDNVQALDVILTGLAIGAGTKPLHDLISRIEKAKDNADPVTQTPTPPTTPTGTTTTS